MKTILRNVTILIAVLSFFSCAKEVSAELSIDITEMSFSKEGGRQSISFITNRDWKAASSASWLKVTSFGTSNNAQIIVDAEKNEDYDDRSATITIIAETLEKTINVFQNKSQGLFVDQNTFNISNMNQTVSVKITSNVDYDVIIPEMSSWITVAPETKGLKEHTLLLNIERNESYIERSTSIAIIQKNGDMKEEINITQAKDSTKIPPELVEEAFNNLFISIGEPSKQYSTPDDFEFLTVLYCNDIEGADLVIPDDGYNWFSTNGDYSSRSNTFRNASIRYYAPMNMILSANSIIKLFPKDQTDAITLNMVAQVKCLRAYSYLCLAPDFQFSYLTSPTKPCVPIVTEDTIDASNNPRASVSAVYQCIVKDLTDALTYLETPEIKAIGRKSKMYIDANVAHGLRARAYLAMGEWQKAYDDAVAAAEGYEPASKEEVSRPSFKDISEHNWIWGYDMTVDLAMRFKFATTSSWLRSFSAWSYSAACGVYACCNSLLYNLIPNSDVRKGWWVDENLESPLLIGLMWPGFSDVAHADDGGDTKKAYIPFTNVKFGCNSVGTLNNDEDMPLMRVEEMILIQAECKAHLGDDNSCRTIMENFVTKYRDPSYNWASNPGKNSVDKVWFQRRVELWGEGFYTSDMHRLNKPLVRFHNETSNMPDAFRFNMEANNPWFLMRFPQNEIDYNKGIVDNSGGKLPVKYEYPSLRDGVTD